MLDSNIILGIRANLGCEDYSHAIMTQDVHPWPCGAPIVYPSGVKLEIGNNIAAAALISPCQAAVGIDRLNVPAVIVHPVNLTPLCTSHKVLIVDDFDIGKYDRLLEFIRDVGAISFVIEHGAGRKHLAGSVKQLESKFKYSSLLQLSQWGDRFLDGNDDNYFCVMTFLDLPYCIPLFNMHKIDGVGLSFSGATYKASVKYGQLNRAFRADIIYSNYEENVLVIDGVSVNSPEFDRDGVYKHLSKLANMKLERGNAPKASSSSKEYKVCSSGEIELTDGPKSAESSIKWTTLDADWTTNQAAPVNVKDAEEGENVSEEEIDDTSEEVPQSEEIEMEPPVEPSKAKQKFYKSY